jgi:hypothetical protein
MAAKMKTRILLRMAQLGLLRNKRESRSQQAAPLRWGARTAAERRGYTWTNPKKENGILQEATESTEEEGAATRKLKFFARLPGEGRVFRNLLILCSLRYLLFPSSSFLG